MTSELKLGRHDNSPHPTHSHTYIKRGRLAVSIQPSNIKWGTVYHKIIQCSSKLPHYTCGDSFIWTHNFGPYFFDSRSFVCQIFKSYYILHCAQATDSFILIQCSVQYLVPHLFIMTLSKPKLWWNWNSYHQQMHLFITHTLSLSPTALQPGVGLGLLQEFPPSFLV